MSTLLDLTAEIVMSHASSTQMTSEQLLDELQKVHSLLQKLEGGPVSIPEETKPSLTLKQAFRKDEVICMICGKGMKTLKKHLAIIHDMKPGQYRKQFGIPSSQALTAKSYSEARKKMAAERGLGEQLVKARSIRAAKVAKAKPAKARSAVKAKAAPKTKKATTKK